MLEHHDIQRDKPTLAHRAIALSFLLAIVIGGIALALRHPGEYEGLPPCPSWAVGVTCPGCGSMRASHFLLNGDLAQAWRHNPAMLILGVPVMGLIVVQCVRLVAGGQPLAFRWAPAWLGWMIVAVVIGYFVARNIPAWDWLRPPSSITESTAAPTSD